MDHFSPGLLIMEHISASTIKADEATRFQLSPCTFKVAYTDHMEPLMPQTRMQFYISVLLMLHTKWLFSE